MARTRKTPHPFDKHLGAAIRSARARRDLNRETLAARTGIPLSNLKRREDGVNETTVSELERIAAALRVSARDIVDMALQDYGADGRTGPSSPQDGLQKLLASVSEPSRTLDEADAVIYLGHVAPGRRDAANTDDRIAATD
ncbi:Helix-turn-helix domain-containing protein [Microbacterium hydrothermale]|uniref:helix-turn-helix domain-containing protein n=1 Tax=Microbacterium hydrothermale TaxID=857427 RepID=UPI0022269E89|nr:helix-turn-helix transcriptional regulator [Microbacterium hydrothermale]MCW2163709.1 Helix-turn-helix domain-containing protein [Microbacterium hydrothermale]